MRICDVVVGSAFAWRRATGEREARWCKRGAPLVSGMIGGIVRHDCSVWAGRVAITFVMSQRHTDLRGLGGNAFARRRATGARSMLA